MNSLVGKKIKICFFGDVAARHLHRWSLYFANNGYEVHIITVNDKLVDDYDPAKVHIIRKPISRYAVIARVVNTLPVFFEVKRLLKKIDPDIIHGQDLGGNSWLAAISGFRPLVVTPWGTDILINARRHVFCRIMTKFSLKKADLVVCDGENTKAEIVKLGIPESKIKLLTFGVDVEKFKLLGAKSGARNLKTVISTRFLTEVHNIETLIRAAAIVAKKAQNVRFVLIGDGDRKEALEKLALDLGVSDIVRFAGRVSEEEMVSRLRSADIYVSTSLSESGLAASTAEAMACELPVINTDTGDIKMWLEDGRGGFVIPVKEQVILAEKILYLLENDGIRALFGKNNRRIIEERNNYFKEMARMDKAYRNLIKNRVGRNGY